MDVELFLEGQVKWEADSPHCLMMLYEMFCHAADQGQKEAEQMVCHSHWQELPKLDPEVDLSAIQLVGTHTSKKEIQSLYLEVYKQQRLLGSPPEEMELMEEVVSPFNDCQGWKQKRAPETAARSWPKDIWPLRNWTPERGRRESSLERSLANVREAHQKVLTMAAALEEEIEQLSCPLARSQPELRTHSRSRDCQIHGSRGQKRRHHQMWSESCLAPYFKCHPSRRNSESGREAMATKDPDLEEPLELGLEVGYFLIGSAENSEEEEKAPSPEPPVEELCEWVAWKAEACKTPGWWRELLEVPEVQDYEELAQKVQASFYLPKRASELNKMENYQQAPPASLCLLRRNFLPPPDSIFACWDIWEMQRGKMVAYTRALQYWAEKIDPPTGGKPCLLAKSVKELWEEMRFYLSFSDKEIFEGMTPLEEMSAIPVKKVKTHSIATMPAIAPEVQATTKAAGEPAAERKSLNSPVGRKYCTHPNLWWLQGRSPIHQEVWGGGFVTGRWWPPLQKSPPPHRK